MAKDTKKADQIIRELIKKRQKLGDADIADNFKNRIDNMKQID